MADPTDTEMYEWLQAELKKPPGQQSKYVPKLQQYFSSQEPQRIPAGKMFGSQPGAYSPQIEGSRASMPGPGGGGPIPPSVAREGSKEAAGTAAQVGLTMAGTALAGPIGGGVANAAGGAIRRGLGGTGGGPISDFAWGAAPPFLAGRLGASMRSYGNPAYSKAVGFLTGKPTSAAVKAGGPDLGGLSNESLGALVGEKTAGGAQQISQGFLSKFGGQMPQVAEAAVQHPEWGFVNGIGDELAAMKAYSSQPNALPGLVGRLTGGKLGSIMKTAGGAQTPASRYLSAVVQASERTGMGVVPELREIIKSTYQMPGQMSSQLADVPGQTMARPGLSALMAQYQNQR